MISNVLKYLILFIALFSTASSIAQSHHSDSVAPRISIITCHAGSEVYELCGHTALRVNIGDSIDMAINYGIFDFNSPNFIYRFVKGETDYIVAAYPFTRFIDDYLRDNRRVVEQQLHLTPEQAWRIVDLLNINLLPQNRVYRYNYVKNNCATKPINILEQAIGDTITFAEPQIHDARGWTFRKEMRHFHSNYPWYQFGIDLALGKGIDYKLSTREKMFAPEALEQMLSAATITDSTGNEIPLVDKTIVLYPGKTGGAQLPPTPWLLSPVAIAIFLLLLITLATILDIRHKKVTRWIDCVLFSTSGIAGLLLTFLIFLSTHEATSPNLIFLWLNPLCFIAATGIWLKKCKSLIICYHFANFAMLIVAFALWLLAGQDVNSAIYPLAICSLIRSASYIYINLCLAGKTA